MHWTQTPKGRKIVARMARERHKASRIKPKQETPDGPRPQIADDIFAYALGRVEGWIEAYAKSAGVPSEALATRLGKVLQSKNSR